MRALAVNDLIAPLGSAAEMFRVADRYPAPGFVRVLPYRRSGGERVLFRLKRGGKQIWSDGSVEWVWMGRAA